MLTTFFIFEKTFQMHKKEKQQIKNTSPIKCDCKYREQNNCSVVCDANNISDGHKV